MASIKKDIYLLMYPSREMFNLCGMLYISGHGIGIRDDGRVGLERAVHPYMYNYISITEKQLKTFISTSKLIPPAEAYLNLKESIHGHNTNT